MKAITIKQPWASLIISGYKKYEFRSWQTKYRGKILIHAGLHKESIESFKNYNLIYPTGAIIGEATLTDCILVDEKLDHQLRQENELVYGHNHVGLFAWKLEDIVIYKEIIPIKGQLGLWNFQK